MEAKAQIDVAAILTAAAQSHLGILALLVIALSLLAYFFFASASENVKVGIFVMLFFGVLGFGIAMFHVASKTQKPITPIRIAHAQYEAFLRDMQATIDMPSMEAGVEVSARFNDGFFMMKAVLPSDDLKDRAQAGYDTIYCQIHRKFNTNSETNKIAVSCNERGIPTNVNPAKRELAELFGALPFER